MERVDVFLEKMFLSNVGGCGTSFTPLYSSAEQPIFTSDPFRNDTTSSHLSFYHYPPTFVQHDHDQLPVGGHLLPQQQLLTSNTNLVTEISIDCASMANIAEKQNPQQQKRLVKKDRHSKIKTAQGIRDRRMRLSLDVARDFFGLQDLRGDDKPSKTIRWLLNQCKGAIKEHSRAKNTSVSSTSECEVVSGIEENSNAGDLERGLMVITDQKQPCSLAKRGKRQPRKTKFHPFGKESREKARARARERTRDKIIRESQKIISSSPSETGEESGVSHGHHEMKSSMTEVEEPNFHLLHLQRPVMATSKSSSPSSVFNFQHHNIISSQGLVCNNVSNCFENLDIDSSRAHNCYSAMANAYPSTGNIQDRISSSVFLTTSELHLPWEV